MKTGAAKFGSTMYFIWGLLHLKAAFLVYQLGATLEVEFSRMRGVCCFLRLQG